MAMSHVRPATTSESTVVFDPLIQEDFTVKVVRWTDLFLACYGPHGKQMMIQNTLGGHVSITSSAHQIVNNVQSSHPLVKFLLGSVKAHCKAYSDNGLFCALLGLGLTSSPITSEFPLSLVGHIRNEIFEIVVEHLTAGCRYCKLKVDVQNLRQLLAIVIAILRTKTACVLSFQEIQFIATVVMQSFLASIPTPSTSGDQQLKLGQTHFVLVEGLSPTHSKHFSGLLYRVVPSGATRVCQLGPNKKIALFDTSLAGDTSEAPVAEFALSRSSSLIEDSLLLQLKQLGEEIIRLGIDVVACQKVVHPSLTKLLQKKGILTLDRLGQETFNLLHKVTGGTPVSCIFGGICEEQLGLADMEEVIIYGKNYLCFKKPNNTVNSILLCHVQEDCLAEVQKACQQSLRSLKLLLSSSDAFVGAGCLEIHLAKIIQFKVMNRIHNLSKDATSQATTTGQVKAVTDDVMKIFIDLGKKLHPQCDQFHSDLEFGHLWPSKTGVDGVNQTCACGLVSAEMLSDSLVELDLRLPTSSTMSLDNSENTLVFREGSVLDVAIPKFAAYKCAFEISLVLLKVGLFIIDTN